MNEIDRILEKGFFKSEFLKPVTICDFHVDENRKKIWLVLLDLLKDFDRGCKENCLQYSLVYLC